MEVSLKIQLLLVALILGVKSLEPKSKSDSPRRILSFNVKSEVNVNGKPLELCSLDPLTGYYRNGKCSSGQDDHGTHVICAEMTREFLQFTKQRGNDLTTPRPNYFPGLKPGDKWCLCALRWHEAYLENKAPPVVLAATEKMALSYVSLKNLQENSSTKSEPEL